MILLLLNYQIMHSVCGGCCEYNNDRNNAHWFLDYTGVIIINIILNSSPSLLSSSPAHDGVDEKHIA